MKIKVMQEGKGKKDKKIPNDVRREGIWLDA